MMMSLASEADTGKTGKQDGQLTNNESKTCVQPSNNDMQADAAHGHAHTHYKTAPLFY